MANLGNPQNTIAILKKYDFNFQKRFGQNFLIDEHVLDKIIASAEITKEDTVLEIGPGIGTMTQYLCENAGRVVAVEIDHNLIPILADTLSEYDNVQVVEGDVLKVNLQEIFYGTGQNCDLISADGQKKYPQKAAKIVANLPYYITTPIIMGVFESGLDFESITVMVQKEVAMRMQAAPGTKDYGALSLAVQYYAEPYLAANVPPNCFMPRPAVGSAVIRLTRHKTPPVQVKDAGLMFRLIRASFNQRRKTLMNGLKNSAELSYSKEEILAAFEKIGLEESVRGETLGLTQFAALADALLP